MPGYALGKPKELQRNYKRKGCIHINVSIKSSVLCQVYLSVQPSAEFFIKSGKKPLPVGHSDTKQNLNNEIHPQRCQ